MSCARKQPTEPTNVKAGRFARAVVFGLTVFVASTSASRAHAQKSPTAQASLGRAYQHLLGSHFAEAAAEMETAVRFEPRFAYGWYLLASASRRAGDPDRAAFAYRRYAELRPGDPDPYFGLGLSLAAVKDGAGALAALRKYVQTERRASAASFVDEARKRATALESDPTTATHAPVERNGQAAALLAARKFAEAAELLRGSIAIAPADANAWYKLGFALRQAGKPVEAAQAYQRSITLQPDDADPYYGLGQVLVAASRSEEALAAFRTYVRAAKDKGDPRWVSKARQEIARLEGAPRPAPHPGTAAPIAPPPATTRTPAALGPTAPPPHAPLRLPSPTASASLADAHSDAGEPTPSAPKTAP